MQEKAAGRCQICHKETALHIDHDHSTGQVRGLLCNSCNGGLGAFKDNPDFLHEAVRYLENCKRNSGLSELSSENVTP